MLLRRAGLTASAGLSCLSTFRLSNRTPKITRILTLYQANAATLIIKSLQKCKGHNAWQFITEFLNKGWTKNMVKFRTVDRRPGSSKRRAHTDENVDTVESLLLSLKDKPQSHRTVREISREAGRSIDHQLTVSQIIHKVLHLKCYKKRCTQQLTEAHSMHALFWYAV